MIDEQMQEQAALHVLGALDPMEARVFKAAMAENAELREYVARLNASTGALAGVVRATTPPAALRGKILARYEGHGSASVHRKITVLDFVPWAIAACLVVVCGLQVGRLQRQEVQLAGLQQANSELKHATQLADVKIAMLSSLVTNQPKTVAVTLWDPQRQKGVFAAQNLPQLPAGKDYELWVIDGTTPVAAGVFHADANGQLRMDFTPTKPVQAAGQFAVTVEKTGGVDSPTVSTMVLAGK